jgi:D-arabinose 1-dehydrogenase-like Zn-dependent alcohol dehydrogenase
MIVRDGVVVEAAPGFEVGQPVLVVSQAPCLACDECLGGRESLCLEPERVEGERVPAACARVKPQSLPPEKVGWLEPLARALHGFSLATGESLAVQGEDLLARLCREWGRPPLVSQDAELVAVCDGDLEAAQWKVARGGTILLFEAGPEPVQLDTTRLHYEQITIQAVRGYRRQDIEDALELLDELSAFKGSADRSGTVRMGECL